MKHFPFAHSRVRREVERNTAFQAFLNERNTMELTRRRDLVSYRIRGDAEVQTVLLSRPITKLPRLQLLLKNLETFTPYEHPDREDIPMVLQILDRIILSSQVSAILPCLFPLALTSSLGSRVPKQRSNFGMLPSDSCSNAARSSSVLPRDVLLSDRTSTLHNPNGQWYTLESFTGESEPNRTGMDGASAQSRVLKVQAGSPSVVD